MEKLALLLLALPLAGCATAEQRAQLKADQLAQAETHCADNPNHLRCVNNFTRHRFGMKIERQDDGSLTLVNDSGPFPGDPGAGGVYGSPVPLGGGPY